LKLKHQLNFIKFPRCENNLLGMDESTGLFRSYCCRRSEGSWTRASSSLRNTHDSQDRYPCTRLDLIAQSQQERERRPSDLWDWRRIAPTRRKLKLIIFPLKGWFS